MSTTKDNYNELIQLNIALLKAIDNNIVSLWHDDLENTSDAIILQEQDVTETNPETHKYETKRYKGIIREIGELETFINNL